MPIQNVNAAASAYQASSAEAQKTLQTAPENTQNSAGISQNADTLEISPNTERLQAQYGIENTGDQRENDLSTVYSGQPAEEGIAHEINTELTGIENGAVPEEQPAAAAEQGVVDNRAEQLQQRQQAEDTTSREPDATNQNRRLDLIV